VVPFSLGQVFSAGASQSEQYFNLNEIIALCHLIGYAGINYVKIQISKKMLQCFELIKHFIDSQRTLVTISEKTIYKESFNVTEHLKKIKDIEEVLQKTMQVGLLINFEGLLNKALQLVNLYIILLLFQVRL
jgi:hypothetical protein